MRWRKQKKPLSLYFSLFPLPDCHFSSSSTNWWRLSATGNKTHCHSDPVYPKPFLEGLELSGRNRKFDFLHFSLCSSLGIPSFKKERKARFNPLLPSSPFWIQICGKVIILSFSLKESFQYYKGIKAAIFPFIIKEAEFTCDMLRTPLCF